MSNQILEQIFKTSWQSISSQKPPKKTVHVTNSQNYRCMRNMARAVARHNFKILNSDQQNPVQQAGCNCRGWTAVCPYHSKCQTDCVVYRATVTEVGAGKAYTGVTGNSWRTTGNSSTSSGDSLTGPPPSTQTLRNAEFVSRRKSRFYTTEKAA